MRKRIHVDPKAIRNNHIDNRNRPTIVLILDNNKKYGHGIKILGPSQVVYKHMPVDGANVWIETDAPVELIIKKNKKKIKKLIK